MAGGLTISGVRELERVSEELARQFPRELRKAIQSGVSEALSRTKAHGLRIATREYAIARESRERVAAQVRISRPTGDAVSGELLFRGAPGVPLRYFMTKPKRGVQAQDGVKPSRRRPKAGVSVKVRRAGQYRVAKGPNGQKTFWFRAPNGAVLLGYRIGAGRKVSAEGLYGASPIQALQKEANFRALSKYADDAMMKRIAHQIDRLMKRKGVS